MQSSVNILTALDIVDRAARLLGRVVLQVAGVDVDSDNPLPVRFPATATTSGRQDVANTALGQLVRSLANAVEQSTGRLRAAIDINPNQTLGTLTTVGSVSLVSTVATVSSCTTVGTVTTCSSVTNVVALGGVDPKSALFFDTTRSAFAALVRSRIN